MYYENNITNYFGQILNDLNCGRETASYIISIYGKYKSSSCDLSQDSITLLFAKARSKQDFAIYQNLGDWIFFSNTINPSHLQDASKEYYDTIARLSYYSCFKLINKEWKLFEELSDNFIYLESQVKEKFSKSIIYPGKF